MRVLRSLLVILVTLIAQHTGASDNNTYQFQEALCNDRNNEGPARLFTFIISGSPLSMSEKACLASVAAERELSRLDQRYFKRNGQEFADSVYRVEYATTAHSISNSTELNAIAITPMSSVESSTTQITREKLLDSVRGYKNLSGMDN